MATLHSIAAASSAPNGFRRTVRTPGSCEAWHVEAHDPANDLRMLATLYHGYPFHPEYLKRLAAYRARPTRNAPPLPEEYPCLVLKVFQDGKRLIRAITQYRHHSVRISPENDSVSFGENKIESGPGGISLHVGCVTRSHQIVSVDMILYPRSLDPGRFGGGAPTAAASAVRSEQPDLREPSSQLWDVGGEIRIRGLPAMPLIGHGDFLHQFAAEPIGYGKKRLLEGSLLTQDQSIQFSIAWPGQLDEAPAAKWVRKSAQSPVRIETPSIIVREDLMTLGRLSYPSGIDLGDDVVLRKPRIVDRSSVSLTLIYEAFVGGQPTTSFCQMTYPPRLRLPMLRGIVEQAIRIG